MGGALTHRLSRFKTWRAWMPGCCHRIVKHWSISEKIVMACAKKKTTTSQLKVKQNLSQKFIERILNFTLCGHQCRSIARQMGLFEEDNVEASSKLLNVESMTRYKWDTKNHRHHFRKTYDRLYRRRSVLEGLKPRQKWEKALSQGSLLSSYNIFPQNMSQREDIIYNLTNSRELFGEI